MTKCTLNQVLSLTSSAQSAVLGVGLLEDLISVIDSFISCLWGMNLAAVENRAETQSFCTWKTWV